ncbi:18582_t:CDS:2, partial [Gigaspora rosea]
ERLDEAQQQIQSNIDSTNVSNSDNSDSNGSQSENAINSEQPVLRNIAEVASDEQNEEQESSYDDSEDLEYDISEPLSHHDTVATTNPADGSLQNSLIIRSMRDIIYNSLFDYWDKPIMVGLLASLLDPWLKTLSNWDEETRERAKEELKYQFSNCKQTIALEHTVTSKNINTHHNRLHSSNFGSSISRNTT